MRLSTLAITTTLLVAPALGWGDEGHKTTAAIAQIYLLPSTERAICNILPSEYQCRLSEIATWPDYVKGEDDWKWSHDLHFLNGITDSPPEDCSFGANGWTTEDNILNGMVEAARNVSRLTGSQQDISLRYLVHFLGDIHQPLHLTGRYRGGNLVPVLYENKETNLHFVWDDSMILYRIDKLSKNKDPLPTAPTRLVPPQTLIGNRRIESVLHGSNYDPLVRWIVVDGIHGWWADNFNDWANCPKSGLRSLGGQFAVGKLPFDDPTDVPVCPYYWSVPSHKMVCDFVWRPDFKGVDNPKDAIYEIELETPEYAGEVREKKIIEKQLALGGIRLAVALNTMLGDPEEKKRLGVLPRLF